MLKPYHLNILKVQSQSSKISNLGKISFSLRIVLLIIHMNHFSYPLTIAQVNIFEEPQNIFSQPKSQTPNYRASPLSIFNYRVPPLGFHGFNFLEIKKFLLSYFPFSLSAFRSNNLSISYPKQSGFSYRKGSFKDQAFNEKESIDKNRPREEKQNRTCGKNV